MKHEMQNSIIIRQMTPADLDAVMELENTAYTSPWTRLMYEQELYANPCACYLVAMDGEKLAGSCGTWLKVGEGHITTLAVAPEYRRQGIARSMMEAALDIMLQTGVISSVTLEVRRSNKPAIALYKSMGFKTFAIEKEYYDDGEDALDMFLVLKI